MSWTVTTTTKVFPTDTPDVIPASDDRIMFSDTSNGGKIKDASIADIMSSPDTVYAWSSNNVNWWVIKANGSDHVYYAWLVNLVRKAYVWFPGSWLTVFKIVNEFVGGDIELQPWFWWNLIVQSQNWTDAWTNYTPARHSGITVSWFTVNSASYKQIGKTVFVQTYLAFTTTSTGNTLNITLPKTVISWKYFTWVTWIGWGAAFNHMWYCDPDDTFHFETPFTSGTSYSIMFSATYETD